jgi:hypothetical protein
MSPKLANDLHSPNTQSSVRRPSSRRTKPELHFGPMTKDFQTRFSAVTLAVLTVAAAVFAFINFQKERQFETPYDGVW